MMGVVNHVTGKPDPKHVDCLERLWVLYADHDLTNSTAALLHFASTPLPPLSFQSQLPMDLCTEVRLKRLSRPFRVSEDLRSYQS